MKSRILGAPIPADGERHFPQRILCVSAFIGCQKTGQSMPGIRL